MPPDPEPTPAAVLDDFLTYLKRERGRSVHTVRAYRADLASLLEGVADLSVLDLPALRRWLAAGHAAGAGRSTLARRAAAARTFTAWARRTGRIEADPGARLASPRPRTALPVVLAAEEATALLDAAGSGAARESRSPCATRWSSSCSTPPACGSVSCAGSTSTTSTPGNGHCA